MLWSLVFHPVVLVCMFMCACSGRLPCLMKNGDRLSESFASCLLAVGENESGLMVQESLPLEDSDQGVISIILRYVPYF